MTDAVLDRVLGSGPPAAHVRHAVPLQIRPTIRTVQDGPTVAKKPDGARCAVQRLLETWPTDEPDDERATPGEGPLYLWRMDEPTKLTLAIMGRPLTSKLLDALTREMPFGQAIVAVAGYYAFSDPSTKKGRGFVPVAREKEEAALLPGGFLDEMLPRILWVIVRGGVRKVRQAHERPGTFAKFETYTPPGTTLAFEFIEQGEVEACMTSTTPKPEAKPDAEPAALQEAVA